MKAKLLAVVLAAFCSQAMAQEAAHWSYEGDAAPQNWSKLNPDFMLCEKGKNQSPIDIHGALKTHSQPLNISYKLAPDSIINNGHSIQVNVKEGDVLTLDGDKFVLQQFHFHAPSENTIDGKSFPLEAHFVHMDANGEIAVVAVMFETGKSNPELEKIWQHIPSQTGQTAALRENVDLSGLLPKNLTHYRFSGSLTTPPCTEGVRWLVVKQPMTVTVQQLNAFTSVMHHANNRPQQKLDGRVIVSE